MSSELKLTNIKHPSSGSNNLVLASDGNVSITNTLSAGTLGNNVKLMEGAIANVHCSNPSSILAQSLSDTETTVLTGSNVNYTPATGARYVVYEYRFQLSDGSPANTIYSGQLQLNDSGTYRNFIQRVMGGRRYGGEDGNSSIVTVAIDLANLDTYFSGISSSHDWKTNAGGS